MKGSMLKRSARKSGANKPRSPNKVLFQDPVGHELPASLHGFRWNVDKVERKLQEKIQEKTKIAGNFVYQQAYRLLECTRGEGIDFVSFKEQLRIKFGIILEDGELQLLFDKYDEDRNGTIDLNEFIRRVLPPDYNYGRQWFELSQQQSEERQAALKRESRNEFLSGLGLVREDVGNTGETSNWTLETLLKQIQAKVVQKTPSGDDQYRRAFKMLRSGRDQGIRMKELRNNLKSKFGIFVSERQMKDLFSQFDMDGSGAIDLKEFLQFVEPPAYPGNSKVPRGLWTDDGDGDGDGHGEEEKEKEDEDGAEGDARGGEDAPRREQARRGQEEHEHEHEQGVYDGSEEDDDGEPAARTGCCHNCRPGSAMPPRPHTHTTGGNGNGNGNGTGPSTSTKNVIKKERPMSANPKKQAMLKQRREQMASTSQLLERHMKETEPPSLQGRRGGGGHHSVTKATQTRRMSMSLVDIHSAAAHDGGAKHVSYNDRPANGEHEGNDDDRASVHSDASTATTMRPRSAGSVASSRPSTAASASSSVRSASYMRRPSTPQHLRQKCLESRLTGAVASCDATRKDPQHTKPKKRASGGPLLPSASAVARRGSGHGVVAYQQPTRGADAHGGSRRHSFPDAVSVEDAYEAPRVQRVHPKQHDVRPFSQGGRVLPHREVSSVGCR